MHVISLWIVFFCGIIRKEKHAEKVWEDPDFLAFLDINPVNPGHTLLIPKKHAEYVFDLEEPLYSGIFSAAKNIAGPLKKAMGAKRIGIGIEGFGVPHIHMHIIPLNRVNQLDPCRARRARPGELAETAKMIRKEMPATNNSAPNK